MPKLVNLKGEAIEDLWTVLADDSELESIAEFSVISLAQLTQAQPSNLPKNLGVVLKPADDASALAPYLSQLKLVVCEAEAFVDGRYFSQGRIVKDELSFSGTLRISGAFIIDQLLYLKRCGFEEFLFADEVDLEQVASSLEDFTEFYQASSDVDAPLFRRRG